MNHQPRFLLIFAVVGLILALTARQSSGQIRPVRLKINKTLKKERGERENGQKPLIQQILYTVELTNAGTSPVNDLVVKYAILCQKNQYDSKRKLISSDLILLQEERPCSTLGIGQKYIFETTAVEAPLRPASTGMEILGYLVEVYAGEKIIAAEEQPQNIKPQITQAKAAEEKKRKNSSNSRQNPAPKK